MPPQVSTNQPESQATPFSEDFLQIMQGLLSPDFLSGLTRDSGTAARQFVNTGGFTPALKQETQDQFGDIRESQGARGVRFGTTGVREEGRILERSANAASANLLGGIQTLGQIDQGVLQQFLQLAMSGILPENTIVSENPITSILKGGAAGAGAAASSGLFAGLGKTA